MEAPQRRDGRIILHFDYDCFYASVASKALNIGSNVPLAVQQKQIIVTCNYEARRRGLYKLQLVHEAKRRCPDVIIILGEDLTRFRNASKDNYNFLKGYSWSSKVERLGFDEVRLPRMMKSDIACTIAKSEKVFMDVTDLVHYNSALLNHNDLASSFFHLNHHDPTVGFPFDASSVYGHTFPAASTSKTSTIDSTNNSFPDDSSDLLLRLCLGSHLARHLRQQLEEQKGYTCTVGIGTNKLISKLVGSLNKPNGQTTLVPPYKPNARDGRSNVIGFIDSHDIGKVPGIGFKISQKLRHHVLKRPAAFDASLVYGVTKENVTVRDVRMSQGMGPEPLGRLLAGPGVPRDLGVKVWCLLHGVDDTEVAKAKGVPHQISIEDSYLRLDGLDQVKKELRTLSKSLIRRMRLDLTSAVCERDIGVSLEGEREDVAMNTKATTFRRWIAHPKTLRLSTRPRSPLNPDATRSRSFARTSKSGSMPLFVFDLAHDITGLAQRLVEETLLSLFRRLHPEKSGWNLSLINLCATNMCAVEARASAGRDIGDMLKKQEDILKDWKIADVDVAPTNDEPSGGLIEQDDINDIESHLSSHHHPNHPDLGSEDALPPTQETSLGDDVWDSEGEESDLGERCQKCGATMPPFAMGAHERFHSIVHLTN